MTSLLIIRIAILLHARGVKSKCAFLVRLEANKNARQVLPKTIKSAYNVITVTKSAKISEILVCFKHTVNCYTIFCFEVAVIEFCSDLIVNQVAMSEEERDRIIQEHEKNLAELESR